jgi:hypothetical protein
MRGGQRITFFPNLSLEERIAWYEARLLEVQGLGNRKRIQDRINALTLQRLVEVLSDRGDSHPKPAPTVIEASQYFRRIHEL